MNWLEVNHVAGVGVLQRMSKESQCLDIKSILTLGKNIPTHDKVKVAQPGMQAHPSYEFTSFLF